MVLGEKKASLESRHEIFKIKKFMINHKLFMFYSLCLKSCPRKLLFYSNQVHLTRVSWVPQLLVIFLMSTNPKRLRLVLSTSRIHGPKPVGPGPSWWSVDPWLTLWKWFNSYVPFRNQNVQQRLWMPILKRLVWMIFKLLKLLVLVALDWSNLLKSKVGIDRVSKRPWKIFSGPRDCSKSLQPLKILIFINGAWKSQL